MTDIADRNTGRRLIIPALGGIYASLGEVAETILRVVAGLALLTHGAGKIVNPFGAAGMVEGLGFHPGAFWSLLLSLTEFFGGFLIALGLLTRPVRSRHCSCCLSRCTCIGSFARRLFRRREVDPVGRDLPLLRDPRRQPPCRGRPDRQGVLAFPPCRSAGR